MNIDTADRLAEKLPSYVRQIEQHALRRLGGAGTRAALTLDLPATYTRACRRSRAPAREGL
jgi:hypothetical protein